MTRPSERITTIYVLIMLLISVITSMMGGLYIRGFLYSDDVENIIEKVKVQFICDIEQDCDTERKPRSSSRPRGRLKNDGTSGDCSRHPAVLQEVDQIVNSEIESGHRILDQDASTSSLFESASEAFLNPNRFIVQWILKTGAFMQEDTSSWKTLSDYHSADSIYTVSSGPEGINDSGSVVIPETGLYYVYGRVTFACKEVDGKLSRLQMRMTVEKDSEPSPIILLEKLEEVRCRLKGDVGTLSVNGLFRLLKGNKVALQYKLPKNISISNFNAPFKTLMGVYKAGKG